MSNTELLIEEIKTLPSNRIIEVLDFVEYIKFKETGKTKYTNLSEEDAILMTSDVIAKYRPALEELAKWHKNLLFVLFNKPITEINTEMSY